MLYIVLSKGTIVEKKQLTMTIKFTPRTPGPLSQDEKNQLTEFFVELFDLRSQQSISIGETYENQ